MLKVGDVGESSVDHQIGHLIANLTNPTVGVLAHPGQVDVRIAAKAASRDAAMTIIAPVEDEVRGLLGNNIFAADNRTMEDVVGDLLRERGLTISVFEDLSGGMAAERLQQASRENFVEGTIANSPISVVRVLNSLGEDPDYIDKLLQDPPSLTNGLARAMRVRCQTHLGLAVHVAPQERQQAAEQAQNLGQGRTYISVVGPGVVRNRTYNYGGRGLPDRTPHIHKRPRPAAPHPDGGCVSTHPPSSSAAFLLCLQTSVVRRKPRSYSGQTTLIAVPFRLLLSPFINSLNRGDLVESARGTKCPAESLSE